MKKSSNYWAYEQITHNAENRIDEFIDRAKKAANQSDKLMYINWAFGVFISWQSLTQGWMVPGDRSRLESKVDDAYQDGY